MSCLRVVDAGVRTLIVDAGRFGAARMGIPRSGAADREALLLANALCGNPPEAAAIEMAVRGPRLAVEADVCTVALAGDAPVTLERDGRRTEVASWRSHTVYRGDRVAIGATHNVLGAVLAVGGGGIAVAPRLGSRSTSLRGGVPGLLARTLQPGDLLPLDPTGATGARPGLVLDAPGGIALLPTGRLRVLAGPQSDALGDAGWRTLTGSSWRVSPRSDRTGLRLEGPRLALRAGADVPSQGCPVGAVQLTGDGVPTILGVDRGTTGGYCVPAVVASVDIPVLGRLRPGAEVKLELVDLPAALALLRRRADELMALTTAGIADTLPPR